MKLALAILLAASAALHAFRDEPELALRGLDPVALCAGDEVAGDQGLEETHGRYLYRFASEASRERFRADPERWCIQWGGGCARMGPLSGRGSAERWTVFDERIFIFASDQCREGFLEDPGRFVVAPEPSIEGSADALADGRRWIEKALAAHGGAAVDAHRALRATAERTRDAWTSQRELVVTSAGEVRTRSTWIPPDPGQSGYDTTWVVAQGDAFTVEEGTAFDVTSPDQKNDLRRQVHREPLGILWARGREDFTALPTGESELGGNPVVDVAVRFDGLATTLHLRPETGLILGLSWRGRPSEGVTRDVVETFTLWRTVEGVNVPAGRKVVADGKESAAMSEPWDVVELLEDVPEGALDRPE